MLDKSDTIKYKYYNEKKELKEFYIFGNFKLKVRRGRGWYDDFTDLLRASYISMPGFISFLEFQVERNQGTKAEYKDGYIYNIDGLNVLKCTTPSERIIISNQSLDYKDDYCASEFPSYWKWSLGSAYDLLTAEEKEQLKNNN